MSQAITFPVSDVALGKKPCRLLDYEASVGSLLHRRVEQISPVGERPLVLCTDAHPFAEASCTAFYQHYPLEITPDAVWFCLAQGFAHHVSLHAEELRHRLVRHEGKAKLTVVRPDFFLGQPNPWPEVFDAFSEQISSHVGRLRDLVVASFSTTGPVERAASQVVLMDAFQPYFEYEMLAGCGLPQVTLRGTPEDWRSVRRRVEMFAEFGLERWVNFLLPVLGKLIATAEGRPDPSFWRSFFRYESGSGPSELTGWIHVLFPYLRGSSPSNLSPNPYLEDWADHWQAAEERKDWRERWKNLQGPALEELPSGLASAPVNFIDLRTDESTPLRFVGGLFGVAQEPETLTLSPQFGWAIVYENPQ